MNTWIIVGIVVVALGAVGIIVGLYENDQPHIITTGLEGSYPLRQVLTQARSESDADAIKRLALSEPRFARVAVNVSEMLGELMVSLSGPVETDNDVFDARVFVFVRAAPAMRHKIGGVWIGGLSPRVPSITQTWDRAPGVPSGENVWTRRQ